jgi:hypothetical protein
VIRALAVAVVAAATILAGGCGGGDSDRLSAEEFRQQANGVCRDVNQELESMDQPTSPAEVGDFVSRAIPVFQSGLDRMREINPPEELESDFTRFVDESAKAIPAAEKLQEAAENQDPDALQEAIQEGDQADERSDEIARDLGLTDCARE